ncbi:integral membrane protein [Actinidia rufa]|uniref:Integral membrane protein n=1 Tax=Actinidia rufa TaxID=165716 RepID=A0A7J0FCG6_9ERIC|nr:integral membrane protein [Actinidia rufa]
MEPWSSSSADSEALIQTLASKGWCFADVNQVKALIVIHCALSDESCTVDSVESELANLDLRSIGDKSLPDSDLLRKSSYLQGPKISSVRDISQSSIADHSDNSSNRLLRLSLTDGHSEITAIEYSHIPSLADDVIPGTKVRLENKASVRNGIVCLKPKVITVLGGKVQSLYEEWQMNQKYSGFARSSLRTKKESDTGGPPPFEKLQIGAASRQEYSGSTSTSSVQTVLAEDGNYESRKINRFYNSDSKACGMDNNVKSATSTERTEEMPSSSEARPKEVVEAVPVQNQAAAQKLLQKMSQPNRDDRHFRGRRHRGKGKRKNHRQDDNLAWQLQNQSDLEDLQIWMFYSYTWHCHVITVSRAMLAKVIAHSALPLSQERPLEHSLGSARILYLFGCEIGLKANPPPSLPVRSLAMGRPSDIAKDPQRTFGLDARAMDSSTCLAFSSSKGRGDTCRLDRHLKLESSFSGRTSCLIPVITELQFGHPPRLDQTLRGKNGSNFGATCNHCIGFLCDLHESLQKEKLGAMLLVFFFTSSKLTKVGEEKKRSVDADFKEGVRRGPNDGVTKEGLLATSAAGCVIGLTFVLLGFFTTRCTYDVALKQLLVILLAALAGLGGSAIDSIGSHIAV